MTNFLNFYRRQDISIAMVSAAKNREFAIKFSDIGFGKRPDVLSYPNEIYDFAKSGATSFHSSEELWENPKLISLDIKKKQIDKLRKGWDLILDIDSPYWKISKITAWLIIQGIRDFGIGSVCIKFSGNKGFHIGVPYEAFPEQYNGEDTRNMFPDAARNIASYLLDYITEKYIRVEGNNDIIFGEGLTKKFRISYSKLKEITGEKIDSLIKYKCPNCKREIKNEKLRKHDVSEVQYLCSKCGEVDVIAEEKMLHQCPKCGFPMDKKKNESEKICPCGFNEHPTKIFNPLSIIEVDTILISSRHLFRMPYSLHEKSGLVSIPFNPDKILNFEKKYAAPEIAKVSSHVFIDRQKAVKGEASKLLNEAMEYAASGVEFEIKKNDSFEALTEAIPEVLFPPCIKKMLTGLEDGKKRSLFVLINFLKCAGWSYDKIEERIKEWNKLNPEPLKDTIVNGQIKYHKRNKDRILPPNCSNKSYYSNMRLCMPDSFCKKIKNPVNYAILRARNSNIK